MLEQIGIKSHTNMRRLLILLVIVCSTCLYSQDTIVSRNAKLVPVADKAAGTVYMNKGIAYPVYIGKKGGRYYWKTSAKGNKYKVYIKNN